MINDEKASRESGLPILFALVVGLLFAALSLLMGTSFTMKVEFRLVHVLIFLLLPGMLAAMAIGHNVHAFALWIAAVVNGVLYAGLAWLPFFIRKRMRRSQG